MTMNETEFSHTHWEITVGMQIVLIYQDAARAVHWFDCIIFIINYSSVHVFTIMEPVTGLFPKLAVQDDWGTNFFVVEIMVNFTPEVFQFVAKSHTFR